MFNNQLVDQLLDAILRGRDLRVAGLRQDDRLHAEDLGRRTGQAATLQVGADVVEVSPPFDPTDNTALVGATMMFEILCLVAAAKVARRGG